MTDTQPTDLSATQLSELLQQLNQTGKTLPKPLHDRLLAAGSSLVPSLIKLVEEDLKNPEPDPDYYGAIHAVQLLGELKDARAMPVLLDCLEQLDSLTLQREKALHALAQLGEIVLEPGIERYWATSSREIRNGFAEILYKLGIRDERIYDILVDTLQREPALGAMFLAEYGDSRALPLLFAKFDELPISEEEDKPLANQVFIELKAAIEDLGGRLSDAQYQKFKESDKLRRQFAAQLDAYFAQSSKPILSESAVEEPVRKAPKPGRNDPCWCGSGKKYKKCHLPLER